MDIKEIKELIKIIDTSSITEFKLDKENIKISIKKEKVSLGVPDSKYIESNRESSFEEKVVQSEGKAIT
ncbi:MAG: hypothetical protein K0R09_3541, partial [Clostridiales bacterium]|nr:hypothetical protein [Clostridiales bacterium]